MKEKNKDLAEWQKLEQQCKQLQNYFDDFEKLKFIVGGIDDLFPGGFSALNQEAGSDVKKINRLFKQLETQLQHLDAQMRHVRG